MEICYINVVLFSEKGKKILLLLREEPKSLDKIKVSLNASPTSVNPQIKLLKEMHFFIGRKIEYKPTLIGETIVESLQGVIETLEVLESK